MRRMRALLGVVCAWLMVTAAPAQAMIVITEILADPPAGHSGDANADGTRSSGDDEFVELYNPAGAPVNLEGWELKDAGQTRHVFPPTLLEGAGTLVIFGGGSPVLPGVNWQTASGGGLSLNNSGDTVRLFDASGTLIDEVIYGAEGGDNQSLVLAELAEDRWIPSKETEGGALFTPGDVPFAPTREEPSSSSVPEPATGLLFGAGLLLFSQKRRNL